MNLILKYIKPYRARMSMGLAIKILGTVAELFLPYILTHILDNVIVNQNVWQIILFGALMILCATVACVMNIIANRMAADVSKDISGAMRSDLFEKTLNLSARDTDRFTIPSLETRITTDTYNIHSFITVVQRMGVRAPILLVGGITLTLIMDYRLSLVMIATMPFIFLIVYFISRSTVPLYTTVQKSVDKMIGVVREDVQGIRVIKALSKNDFENRRFDEKNRLLSRDERRAGIITGLVNPLMMLVMNLGITAVVALSAYLTSQNNPIAPTVIAFLQYFTLISMAMMAISRLFVMFTKCLASAKRIEEVMDTPDTYFVTEKSKKEHTGAHIEFKNVSFSYLGKRNNLENVSFKLGHGESLGIIGATGSGKSTLIKLIMRFYEADSGEILINGENITSYTREELSSMFGVALQHDFLYADTVEENIRFGRDADLTEVIMASIIAQAHDFVMEKEGRYGSVLAQKGVNLSGGQKQRLLIARAVLSNPEILILDDSSSALDYKTDANLRIALKENLSSTVVTVAQRVSSIKDCDHIIVLDDGRVIGQGTHEHLINTCPEYKEISDSQMGGAFVE